VHLLCVHICSACKDGTHGVPKHEEEILCISSVYIAVPGRLALQVDFYTMHGTRNIKP